MLIMQSEIHNNVNRAIRDTQQC